MRDNLRMGVRSAGARIEDVDGGFKDKLMMVLRTSGEGANIIK